ncbi:MAG: glycosyltransferase [Bdellovibrionales bacterium]|nr:glycosyltransferase [Bdellovibrionales bacterium]
MAAPRISVVLPVFNQAELLAASVRSVLEHSCEFQRELIVVDDGSTDDISGVLEEFEGDPRIRVIRQDNRGVAAALNRGFAAATGHFWSWTSADNYYLPRALDRLARYLLIHPTTNLVYANFRLIDEAGNPLVGSGYRPQNQNPLGSPTIALPHSAEALAEWGDNFIGPCFLYRRSAANRIGPYVEGSNGIEDFDYWLRLQRHGRLSHLDDDASLYCYRLHPNSLTATTKSDRIARAASARAAEERATRATVQSSSAGSVLSSTPPSGCWLSPLWCGEDALEHADGSPGRPREWRPPMLNLLKLSRDCDYRAAPASEGARILMLPQSAASNGWELETARRVVLKNPDHLFLLLCSVAAEREWADELNRRLAINRNLRIIDVTDQSGRQLARSVSFVLSSVELVLSLLPESDGRADLRQLYYPCVLSAAAGRLHLALCQAAPDERCSGSCGTGAQRNAAFEPIPHLKALEFSKESEKLSQLFTRVAAEHQRAAPRVMDDWLASKGK